MVAGGTHRSEATVYARYLLDVAPSEAAIQRWMEYSVARIDPTPSRRDQELIALAVRRPVLLGALDGGLALRRPDFEPATPAPAHGGEILETAPEHADRFLPASTGRAPWLPTVVAGLRAGLRGAIGVVPVTVRWP